MKLKYIIIAIVLFSGCQKIYFKDEPANTPVTNFEIFWNDFDRYYAQFNLRNINWDSVYTVYSPQVNNQISERELYAVLSKIVVMINDMHVSLHTPFGYATWKGGKSGKYPSSKLIAYKLGINPTYLNTVMSYSALPDNIGYIQIPTFVTDGKVTNGTDARYSSIDKILEMFKDKDGIIIDVRMNGGGNSSNAKLIASRFADKKRLSCRGKQKTGPGRYDFSDWIDWFIEPDGDIRFEKPVVVLTSRSTSSSAEIFVTYMNVLPQVTIVGDTTGGGSGNPLFRELPNGWTYRLSTMMQATADNYIFEGKGIIPDITVQTSVSDSINGIDRILEKGIDIIKESK